MTRARKTHSSSVPFRSLSSQQRVAAIRYNLDWQGTALRLQYDRLKARTISPENFAEHMPGRVDMDFFIVVVRRILRIANQAKGSGLDTNGYLKPIVRDFEHRWEHIIDARDTLAHVDEPKAYRALLPMSSSDGKFIFLMPENTIDIHELFIDSDSLCRAIGKVIKPYESETTTSKPSS